MLRFCRKLNQIIEHYVVDVGSNPLFLAVNWAFPLTVSKTRNAFFEGVF